VDIHRTHQLAGFTLIEVLVAVLVLAIGLLGLAALQVTGLRNNHSAYLRSQATTLALDMADRMRANKIAVDNPSVAADDNQYALVTGAEIGTDPGYDCASTFPGSQTTCTSSQMAQIDIYQWLMLLQKALPSGTGTVTCNDRLATDGDTCTTGSVHVIAITWDDNRNGLDATDPTFRYGFQP
jgi:type IV pilus assembly protein PilV